MWLGHASFLIRINGTTFLTDPCFGSIPMYRRHTDLPVEMAQVNIDNLLVSHGHYDYFNADSIRMLKGDRIQAHLPLKLGTLVRGWNRKITVQEAGWYQQFDTDDGVDVFFVPAHHWYRRSSFDLNGILWGSYIVRSNGITIYFAGDSCYSSHFKEIGKRFARIDYALLPIGAYDPPFIMKRSHMNPAEAVRAFHDLNARVMIPMHYGTFDLADEPKGEPRRWLQRLLEDGKIHGEVSILDIGECLALAEG